MHIIILNMLFGIRSWMLKTAFPSFLVLSTPINFFSRAGQNSRQSLFLFNLTKNQVQDSCIRIEKMRKRLQLSLSANGLPNLKGMFQTSDPFAVVTHRGDSPDNSPEVVGCTDV